MQIKRLDKRESNVLEATQQYLEEQKKRLLSYLEQVKGYQTKSLIDEVFNLELEIQLGKGVYTPVLIELLELAGIDAMALAGSAYTFYMNSTITSWLDQRTDLFLRQINTTTFNTLKEQFAESFAQAEGRDKLIERIEGTYAGFTERRAAVIARTETHAASQFGTMEGYKQAGLGIKIWVSTIDGATRQNEQANHVVLDGEERPIDMPFSNGLMYPGESGAPASEVINCRCVI